MSEKNDIKFLFNLFQNKFSTSVLQELQAYDAEIMSPEISTSIKCMLKERENESNISNNINFQEDLDVLLLTGVYQYKMKISNFKELGFKLHKEHLLSTASIKDIGIFVRRLLLRWPMSDVLFKLYQYSMPFIKHNRLNFPSIQSISDESMMHMLQTIQMTCLGIHHNAFKKPTWKIRGKLFFFFNELLTRGTFADLYLFCQSHIYLLRISLIENFMSFLEKNMPTEESLLHQFIDTSYDHKKVSKMLYYIIDNFRQISFQDEFIDWTLVEEKAQQTIERCNRTCKSMPNFKKNRHCVLFNKIDLKTFHMGMQSARLDKNQLCSYLQKYDLLELASLHNFYARIQIYNLPLEIQLQQFQTLIQHGRYTHQNRYNSLLYICLQCNEKHSCALHDMRLHYYETPTCTFCNTKNFVIAIQTLGRLVRVHSSYYYFCIYCKHNHVWKSFGDELFKCSYQHNNSSSMLVNRKKNDKQKGSVCLHERNSDQIQQKAAKHCIVCLKTMQIILHNVFDSELGVMQSFYLCFKHSPQPCKMEYVKNLTILQNMLQFIK